MSPVIELLATYDKQFREFILTGTKTDTDGNLVSIKESPYWRLMNKDKEAEKKKKAEETASTQNAHKNQSVETGAEKVATKREVTKNVVSATVNISDSNENAAVPNHSQNPIEPTDKNRSIEVHAKAGQSKKKKTSKRKSSLADSSEEDSLTSGSDTSDEGEASGEDSDDNARPIPKSGQANTSYVRKRSRGKISLDSDDDDDSDEWNPNSKKSRKRVPKVKQEPLSENDESVTKKSGEEVAKVKPEPPSDNEDATVTVIASKRPPKRASAAKVVFKEEPDFLSDDGEF